MCLKTWTPLPDRFIDEHLVEMFPLFNQARLQRVDFTNAAAVHTLRLQLPQISQSTGLRSGLLAGNGAGAIVLSPVSIQTQSLALPALR